MGTSIRFTPLSGVGDEEPLCYLLEIDNFTILLDCGWDESFDEALLEPIKRVLPRVDAVLLSHPDLAHLGALPYLVGQCGLRAPIYSTKPVRRMGEMFLFEACLSKQAVSEFSRFSLDDVDSAFRLNPAWTELRYHQRHVILPPAPAAAGAAGAARDSSAPVEGEEEELGGGGGGGGERASGAGAGAGAGGGICITPLPAGRFPGGAVWRVGLLGSGEEVVYAVDYNHRKERLLNETTFHELLSSSSSSATGTCCQPALLVSDCLNALAPVVDRRRRDEELLDAIRATVEGEGSVLLPTDAAGRVLELALLLDEHFAKARVAATPVLLSSTIKTVLEFARSQLEYFGSEMAQAFSLKRTVPFSFRKLSVITRVEELGAFPGPKVVLATMPSLESGPARQLLVEWAAQRRNTIIFTERANANTLAGQLQRYVPSSPEGEPPLRLPLRLARRVPLEGEELAAWQAARAAEVAAAAEERLGGGAIGGLDMLLTLAPTPSLTAAARLAAATRLSTAGSLALPTSPAVLLASSVLQQQQQGAGPAVAAAGSGPGGGGLGGGGGGGGGGLQGVHVGTPSAAAVAAAAAAAPHATPATAPLRASTGCISRLVRDAATGAIVQQLVGGAGGGGVTHGSAGAAAGAGGGAAAAMRAGWDAGLLVDGFEPPKDAAYPMFPDDDEALYTQWDEYGAVLGKDEFRVPMLSDAPAALGGGRHEGMEVDDDAGSAGGGDVVCDEVDEAPSKLVEEEVVLELRAALRFFDFEGRSDGRAMREYLARAAPRRLALVHGSPAARAELAGAMRAELGEFGTAVYTPGLLEPVEAQLAPSHLAALSQSLAEGLAVRQAGQYGVSWLEGVMVRGSGSSSAAPLLQIEPLPTDSGSGQGPAAAAVPPGVSGAGAGSVLLAQAGSALTLSRLKAALAAAGFESHFPSRGVLAVMAGDGAGGALIVTLGGGGGGGPTAAAAGSSSSPAASCERAQVVLEGPASEAFFRVREVIYQQFGVC
ncbi:hypothetical protein Agub_g8051 [Astrephomene gubernaculifera]|uniref:Cleavage and polyadenylation specificity factor subunit 2 n=1 Tax=Astrephomene gubernaculifera TaxID=47775 RepID=A0AAD3HM53_9CHLO|nr:hypothetical protein Agub_g8051 [Astrephomene gubernaculifera]